LQEFRGLERFRKVEEVEGVEEISLERFRKV